MAEAREPGDLRFRDSGEWNTPQGKVVATQLFRGQNALQFPATGARVLTKWGEEGDPLVSLGR